MLLLLVEGLGLGKAKAHQLHGIEKAKRGTIEIRLGRECKEGSRAKCGLVKEKPELVGVWQESIQGRLDRVKSGFIRNKSRNCWDGWRSKW